MLSFRDYHTLNILNSFATKNQPLDALIRSYLRLHKAIGSKDRNHICKNIYFIIRNLSFIDAHLEAPHNWEKRLEFVNTTEKYKKKESLPLHIKTSHPKWLFDLLKSQYPEPLLENILQANNTEAPLTIRVNLGKTTLKDLKEELSKSFAVEQCQKSPLGLKFFKREPITSLASYKDGLFEIQDEASQLSTLLLDYKPGMHVLDFCSGAGGKALSIAPYLHNKGLIYVHDVRTHAVAEARKRFERAGFHNVKFYDPSHPLERQLTKKMDVVITDVPCTGSGTFRRNPDLKWKLSPDELSKLVTLQRNIFAEALNYVRPGGHILYSTCSILKEENQNQIEFFLKQNPELTKIKELVLLPEENGHDGFYACVLALADKG